MSMDSMSMPQGVPLSTTQADVYPKVSLSSSSGSSSFPIRAPLTIDSDTTSNYSNDNGLESEGFLSDEDEFGNVPERPFVAHPDDETPEETSGDEEFVVSRPFVTDPEEEIIEETSNVEKFVVSRPFVLNPDRIVTENRVFSRPIVANVNEETLVTPPGEGGEYDLGVETKVMDYKWLSLALTGVPPIAPLSRDSDEDSVGSVVEEDDGLSGVARIPSTGMLEKLSAPKVQVLGVEEGDEDEDEDESQFEAVLESEVVEDSISGELLNGVVGFDEEQVIVEKDSVKDSISAGLVKYEGLDAKDVAKSTSLVESEVSILLDSSVLDESSEYAVEEIQALTNMEQVTELYETNSSNLGCDASLERSSKTQGEMTVDSIHDKEVIEGGQVLGTGTDEVKSVIYFAVDSLPLEADKDVGSKNEADLVDIVMGLEANAVRIIDEKSVLDISGEEILERSGDMALKFTVTKCANEETAEVDKNVNLDAVCVNNQNCEYNAVEVNESTILSPGSGSGKLESIIEQETDFCNGHSPSTEGGLMEDDLHSNSNIFEPVSLGSDTDHYLEVQNSDEADCDLVRLKVGEEGSHSDDAVEGLTSGELDTVKDLVSELEKPFSSASLSGGESSRDHSQRIEGQIVTVSDEVDTDVESECETLFDSAAFTALLNAAKGAEPDGGSVSFTSADGSRIFSLDCHAGLSSTVSSMELTPQSNHPNLSTYTELDSEKGLSKEEEMKKFEIQQIRVKFLRLLQRLGLSAEDSIASQVLYRLDLASGRPSSRGFSLESAKREAIEFEADKKNELDFSLNILIIGKSGVGKSATINSIFEEEKARINPFEPSTTSVKEIVGTIDGIKVRVLDTPGLRSSLKEQSVNKKILKSVKRFTKNYPPDVVIYADRLDIQTRDLNDLPLLRSITSSLGSSVWRNSIVTLTHAASTPPDGPSGSPLSYEMFVTQRSRVVQQLISHAVGDLHMINAGLMCPVCLVENHQLCKKNGDGQFLLPNGETWRPQLLLLCYSMKILSEANSIVKAQVPLDHRKLFGWRVPLPPLPYFLSSLLQSCAHPKLSSNQGGDNVDSDIELECSSDSDQEDEDEDEYDQLPPFKPLRKSEIAKLSKEQIKAYFEEYDYRVKLLQNKQWREDIKRFRERNKKGKEGLNDFGCMEEEQETGSSAAAAIPLPDMILPPSFNGENSSYRYRFLEPTSHLVARPVLVMHGWDHDWGCDGVSLEQSLAVANQFPAVIVAQITKDKKEFNIHLDSSVSAKHWKNGSIMAGLDIQTIGAQLAYILKGETKRKNFKMNKTAVGGSITFLGENMISGLKLEDDIAIGKQLVLVGSCGAIQSQGDTAYGANLEMRLREKDYPVGQNQTTLSLSLMRWRGDLIWDCNMQSQFSIGRNSKLAVSAGLNKQRSGQISVSTSSSEQLQIALVGLIPIARTILRNIFPSLGERY